MRRNTTDLGLTRQAIVRGQQRGVKLAALELIAGYGDCDLPAGHGCVRRMLSHAGRAELLADGHKPALVERAARLTLVLSDDGAVVTVWPRRCDTRRVRRTQSPRLRARR